MLLCSTNSCAMLCPVYVCIAIYLCVCVCVCVYVNLSFFILGKGQDQRIPVILTLSPGSVIPVGSELILTCARDHQTSGVVLSHDGVIINIFANPFPRITYSFTSLTQTWTYSPVAVEDQGVYVCLVSIQDPDQRSSLPQTLVVIVGKL